MRLNRTNLLLIGLLILQIVLGAVSTLSGTQAVESSRGPLLNNFTPETVSKIVITDGSDKTKKPLTITKSGESYVLPDFDNYPVDASKVSTLTASLRNLDTRRLIAQNKSSQNRLKVASDAFDRQIVLRVGDKDLTLYLGTANEASAAYTRLSDSDAIYLPTGLSVNDVSANPVTWVNPAYLTLTTDDVVGLTVENSAGKFVFRKENGTWALSDMPLNASEKFNADAVTSLVSQLGTVSLSAPIGVKADDKLGMAKPSAIITIQTRKTLPPTATPPPTATSAVSIGGNPPPLPPPGTVAPPAFEEKTVTLQLGAKLEDGNYALKSSESMFYVETGAGFATSFVELNRSKIVTVIPTVAPTNTPFGPLALPTNTPTAATPTVVPPTTSVATEVPPTISVSTATVTVTPTATVTATP